MTVDTLVRQLREVRQMTVDTLVRQIRDADGFVSNGGTGRDWKVGRAVEVRAVGEFAKITLDTGDRVSWKIGQDMAEEVARGFERAGFWR